MAMGQLTVVGCIRSVLGTGHEVVDFHHVVHGGEEQSTVGTPPFLSLEQGSPAGGQVGVATQARGPVQEIAIVEAGLAPDLGMSLDERLAVSAESSLSPAAKDPVALPLGVPV